jgi:uncharacterized protein with PIN domain
VLVGLDKQIGAVERVNASFSGGQLAIRQKQKFILLPPICRSECAMNTMPRFLCDEMLGRLCRYLRAAGYDALLARNGTSDAELLRQCHAEGRHFLTQDMLVREHKAARGVALILPHVNLDHLAALLDKYYQLDWLDRAFTRCVVDNTLLLPADDGALARAPADARRPGEPLYYCPACGRIYWRGSHYKRMRAKLVAWQAARKTPSAHSAMKV